MTTPPQSDLTGGAGSLSEATSPGTSELFATRRLSALPDAAAIARMANAFYASPPSQPDPGSGRRTAVGAGVRRRADLQFAARRAGAAAAAVAEPQSRPAADADPGLRRRAAVGAGVRRRAAARSGPIAAAPASASHKAAKAARPCAGAAGLRQRRPPHCPSAARRPRPRRRPAWRAIRTLRRCPLRWAACCRSFRASTPPSPYGRSGLQGRPPVRPFPAAPTRSSIAALHRPTTLRRAPASARRPAAAAPTASAGTTLPFAFDVSVLDLSGAGLPAQPCARRAGNRHHRRARVRSLRHQARLPDPAAERQRPARWSGSTTPRRRRSRRASSIASRTSTSTRTRTSTARAHTLAARSTDAYEARARRCARFINAPSPEEIIFVRGTTEGINLVAKTWGGRNVNEGDEIVITHLEHHANIVPWQHARRREGRRAARRPGRRSAARSCSTSTRSCSGRGRASSSLHAGLERARHHHAGRRHDRHRPPPRRPGRRRRRPVGLAHAGRRAGAATADFFVFSGHKMFAPDRHRRRLRQARASSKHMPPWQGGGNMIQDVTFEKTTFHGPPGALRSRHRQHRRRGRPRRGDRLPHRRIGIEQHRRLRARAARLRDAAAARACPACASSARRTRRPACSPSCSTNAASEDVGKALDQRRHRRARRPSLRPADPPPLRPRSDRAAVAGALQYARRRRCAHRRLCSASRPAAASAAFDGSRAISSGRRRANRMRPLADATAADLAGGRIRSHRHGRHADLSWPAGGAHI